MNTSEFVARWNPDIRIPADRLERLRRFAEHLSQSDCTRCQLAERRFRGTGPVLGEGRGRIMLVGHRVGRSEANTRRPAIGDASLPAFSLFLEAMGLKVPARRARDLVLDVAYATNVTRCGVEQNINPGLQDMRTCSQLWLMQEIIAVDPVVIVCWGRQAAQALLGSAPEPGRIAEARIGVRSYPVYMLSVHPAHVVRKPASREVVLGEYRGLVSWLRREGWLRDGQPLKDEEDVRHHLITQPEELSRVMAALEDCRVIALDTETYWAAQPDDPPEHIKAGPTSWMWERHRISAVQLAGLSEEGRVTDTWTLACGFVDMMGRPQQELTTEHVRDFLLELLRKKPGRLVFVWNALFDLGVLLRMGVDLIGLTGAPPPVQVVDGMLVLARLNEHLGDVGALGLGAAARIFLGETKTKFTEYFTDVPLERLNLERDREQILAYTGEDPRLTLEVTARALKALGRQLSELGVRSEPTPLEKFAVGAFPPVDPERPQPRLLQAALPIDLQMTGILARMRMVGFRFDRDRAMELRGHIAQLVSMSLSRLRQLGFRGQPTSSQHVTQWLREQVGRLVEAINRAMQGAEREEWQQLLEPLGIAVPRSRTWQLTTQAVIQSYERIYGPLTSESDGMARFISVHLGRLWRHLEQLAEGPLRERLHHLPVLRPIDTDGMLEVLSELERYRKLQLKIWATYFQRFATLSDEWGIFNPEYKLHDTTSGRLSGNAQNIPRGGDELEWPELDVRLYLRPPQAEDLNRLFGRFGLPWRVREDDEYVLVTADYSAMEDRMAYALTGDRTKGFLLSRPDIDTHFYNAAFLFRDMFRDRFDVDTEEGLLALYNHLKEDPEGVGYKKKLRTPVKSVHFAKQYGGGVAKLHTMILPVMVQQGQQWTEEDTRRLVEEYSRLYAGVEEFRREVLRRIERDRFVEYPVFGYIRHVEAYGSEIREGEPLSVANALNQGTCAYIAKLAMLRCQRLIHANARRWRLVEAGGDAYVGLVLQVHDEIGIIAPLRLAREVAEVLLHAMRIIVGPPREGRSRVFYDEEIASKDGSTGWLYLPDEGFRAAVLLDAEAEVKRTLAKTERLPDGTPNIIDPEALEVSGIDASYELVLRDFACQ